MGLEFYANGVAGELLVEDRRPDGSVILLECTPLANKKGPQAAPAAKPSPGGSWPMLPKPAGVTVSSSPSGSWPMMQETNLASARHGKLHLDTTRMPGGVLRFNVSTLAARASQALTDGVRLVELTTETADDWGYLGEARPPVVGEEDLGPQPPDTGPARVSGQAAGQAPAARSTTARKR